MEKIMGRTFFRPPSCPLLECRVLPDTLILRYWCSPRQSDEVYCDWGLVFARVSLLVASAKTEFSMRLEH